LQLDDDSVVAPAPEPAAVEAPVPVEAPALTARPPGLELNDVLMNKPILPVEAPKANGKRVRPSYSPSGIEFTTEEEALAYMTGEFDTGEKWVKERERSTDDGLKWWYHCSRCKATVKAYMCAQF
jgi:hypothetical protein